MATLVAEAELNRAHLESSAGILGQQQQLEEAARKQVCCTVAGTDSLTWCHVISSSSHGSNLDNIVAHHNLTSSACSSACAKHQWHFNFLTDLAVLCRHKQIEPGFCQIADVTGWVCCQVRSCHVHSWHVCCDAGLCDSKTGGGDEQLESADWGLTAAAGGCCRPCH